MKYIPLSVALTFTSFVAASPTSAPQEDGKLDWKYTHGWSGVTEPVTAVGTLLTVNETGLEKRTVGGVFACTDINWTGKCAYTVYPLHQCVALGSGWAGQISSFGPDQCTECIAYGSNDCSTSVNNEEFWEFFNPGDATGGLQTSNPWNDKINSVTCVPTLTQCS